jgi:signal transduction histidine kinase
MSSTTHGMEYLTKNPEKGSLTVEVIDTGVGIEQDQIEKLFKPFT